MVEGTIFIGAVIIAVTELIKRLSPAVHGVVTIFVSALVGLVVALVDQFIGVSDMSIAQGIMAGLAASGAITTATALGTTAPPKP